MLVRGVPALVMEHAESLSPGAHQDIGVFFLDVHSAMNRFMLPGPTFRAEEYKSIFL